MTNEKIAEQLVKECGITAPYDNLKKLVVDALEMKDGMAEIDSTTTSKTNEEKAKHIDVIFECSFNETFYNMAVKSALQMAKWKDEQIKQTLVDFMQYLNKRDFFHNDLCFDIEHQVETYLDLRNRNKTK